MTYEDTYWSDYDVNSSVQRRRPTDRTTRPTTSHSPTYDTYSRPDARSSRSTFSFPRRNSGTSFSSYYNIYNDDTESYIETTEARAFGRPNPTTRSPPPPTFVPDPYSPYIESVEAHAFQPHTHEPHRTRPHADSPWDTIPENPLPWQHIPRSPPPSPLPRFPTYTRPSGDPAPPRYSFSSRSPSPEIDVVAEAFVALTGELPPRLRGSRPPTQPFAPLSWEEFCRVSRRSCGYGSDSDYVDSVRGGFPGYWY